MALVLKPVEAARGSRWVSDAFNLFGRRPMAFTAMAFILSGAAMLVRLLPLLGALLPLALLPLITLGFMVAGQSALLDGPVHPRQFIEPLRTDAARRRALLLLCASYGLALVATLLLADSLSDHAWARLQALGAQGQPSVQEVEALLPKLGVLVLVLGVLISLLSAAYWHAPALVHWGGQGAGQALFSSTLAVWRCKGAFAAYMAVWTGLLLALTLTVPLVLQLLGLQAWTPYVVLPCITVLSAVFYISVLFTFNDSFGGAGPATATTAQPPPPG